MCAGTRYIFAIKGMVIQSRIRLTSVSTCWAAKGGGGSGRCPRNSRKARAVRKPKKPTIASPMRIRLITNARCFGLYGLLNMAPSKTRIGQFIKRDSDLETVAVRCQLIPLESSCFDRFRSFTIIDGYLRAADVPAVDLQNQVLPRDQVGQQNIP